MRHRRRKERRVGTVSRTGPHRPSWGRPQLSGRPRPLHARRACRYRRPSWRQARSSSTEVQAIRLRTACWLVIVQATPEPRAAARASPRPRRLPRRSPAPAGWHPARSWRRAPQDPPDHCQALGLLDRDRSAAMDDPPEERAGRLARHYGRRRDENPRTIVEATPLKRSRHDSASRLTAGPSHRARQRPLTSLSCRRGRPLLRCAAVQRPPVRAVRARSGRAARHWGRSEVGSPPIAAARLGADRERVAV